ncbi:energy transducer TonB [uncultured Microbulbifer sp.]|uniref:energy transducer TonB n=1 Tax=uncultured Microbulbifer sp. TaxID=348147 RepID=UPI00260366D7|nr:energy transducer TonB [uncultured Microbulbifer sp.]
MDRAYPPIASTVFFPPQLLAGYAKGFAFAALMTLGLIFLMSRLIASDFEAPVVDDLPSIQPVHIEDKKVVTEKTEPPVKPQTPPLQSTTTPVEITPTEVGTAITIRAPVPSSDTTLTVTRDPVPVYKPLPRYPNAAARRGIEGYVVVEFTVTKTGAVRDARVVGGFDSAGNPTRVFNRSALAAAERFKYQPQMADGEPVERYGVRNRITYKMAD